MGARGLALALGLALTGLATGAGAHDYVFVQATMTKDIYVVDAETYQVIDRIQIGDYTDDVVGSPDGRLAFGNAQIGSGSPLGWEANDAGKVFAIDTATDKIVWSTFVDGSPHHLAVSPDGSRVYVPLFDRAYLLVLDAHTGQQIQRWYTLTGNHSTEVSRDGARLYVGNMLADLIWVYDTSDGKIVRVIHTGAAVRPLRLAPDQTHIIYQLSRLHGFKVSDVTTGALAKTVSGPPLPAAAQLPDAYPYTIDHGLGVTPDGARLLTASSIGGYVAIYRLPDYTLIGTVKVGDDPNWVAFRSDSKIAFVTDRGSNALSVVDLAAMSEVKRIPMGRMPQRLSVISAPHREASMAAVP